MLFTNLSDDFDHKKFLEDFKESKCYWPPLKLEDADQNKFLETTLQLQHGTVAYRLKNDNEQERKVWRYHHYRSRLDYTTKRATMMATLRKVHLMASDGKQLLHSILAKCKEFYDLEYPPGILRHMCRIIAHETGHPMWTAAQRYI